MKGDKCRNFKLHMIGKEYHSVTTQEIKGETDGGVIVVQLKRDLRLFNTDAFACFLVEYELPMYDFDADEFDPPAEWSDEVYTSQTLDGIIRLVTEHLNVEDSE